MPGVIQNFQNICKNSNKTLDKVLYSVNLYFMFGIYQINTAEFTMDAWLFRLEFDEYNRTKKQSKGG